ncbi:MAG: class I SAM-dependent methyltransferase [Proteobacteria bacterium]|nr:class I SAM-dependent methyltransferase [Pseudomonadota bacterium]
MARWHLFEIEDQPWCPSVLRDAGTAYITKFVELGGLFEGVMPKLAPLFENAESGVDLCSGSGGPARLLVAAMHARGRSVRMYCTDLYPNLPGLRHEASRSGGLTIVETPVDATAVPADLVGPRTLFNAFHHFRPPVARGILEDAVRAGQPIAVVEFVGRQLHAIPGMLGVPFAVLAMVPFLRPFRWSWVPLTYLFPLIPLFVQWDGVVSCLRVYSPDELRELVVGLDEFEWDIGTFPLPFPGYGTYLVGTPKDVG